MVLGYVGEADYQAVARALRHRVSAIERQRERRGHLLEAQGAESQPVRLLGFPEGTEPHHRLAHLPTASSHNPLLCFD